LPSQRIVGNLLENFGANQPSAGLVSNMALTDMLCRNAKGRDRPYKLSDSGGLQLWVHTSGSRTWRMAYRFDGKQKALSLGQYPDMSLARARELRDDHKKLLKTGVDPAAVIPAAKAEEASALASEVEDRRFRSIAKTWFDAVSGPWVEPHKERVWSRMEHDVFPEIGDKQVSEIMPPDVLALVRKVESRGALDVSRRIRQSVSQVFRFAIAEGWRDTNPAADIGAALKARPKVKHFAALKERDLPAFLRRLEAYDGDDFTRYALELTIQAMVRTNETRFARWDEFEDLDSRNPLWRIPPERMKMGREHVVPLARQTVVLLKALRQRTGNYEHLFPAPTKSGVISQNTMIFALYRMGYHSRATVHGFRRTASTILNENNWNRDWVEKQLAHDEEDEVRAAYNAAEYLPGRRKMVQWWCDRLDQLRSQHEPSHQQRKRRAPAP
jgi:integrase